MGDERNLKKALGILVNYQIINPILQTK